MIRAFKYHVAYCDLLWSGSGPRGVELTGEHLSLLFRANFDFCAAYRYIWRSFVARMRVLDC